MSDEKLREIWEAVRSVVESGNETRKIDLKNGINFAVNDEKAKFIRNICAIANTGSGRGFLVIGVRDNKDRVGSQPSDFLTNWQVEKDQFEQDVTNILSHYVEPFPLFDYHPLKPYESQGITDAVGVIEISESTERPHIIKEDLGGSSYKIRKGQIYIRRNTESRLADRNEIVAMINEAVRRIHQEEIESIKDEYESRIAELSQKIKGSKQDRKLLQYENKLLQTRLDERRLENERWEDFCAAALQLTGLSPEERRLRDIAGRYNKIAWLQRLPAIMVAEEEEED